MLITPVTIQPLIPSTTQPDVIANNLHNVQVQAAPPITPNAITPPPKGEKGNRAKERRNEGREPSDDQESPLHDHEARNRGENVNLSV